MDKEFKSDNIDVKVERQPKCIIKLTVKATPTLVKQAHKNAIKEVNKDITMPGFRKGKAPTEMILKQYGPNVEQKWQKIIADLSFVESQKLTSIYPLNNSTKINFDLKSHCLEDGATLTFSFETEPEFPPIDTKKFKLKEIKKARVDDKKINETIRQAQFFYATWSEADRAIQKDDYVILDLESLDTTTPTKVFSNTRFEVKDKSIANWMQELLIGAKKGDIIEGISKPDDDLPEKEKKKFEEKKVRITVIKIEEANLPELNDEFAQKMGTKDIGEMTKNITNMLVKQEEAQIDREKKEEVNNFLLENYDFDLPPSLLSSETKYRKDQMLVDPKYKKKWDEMKPEEKKQIEERIQKQAKDAVSLFYISRKIVNDSKIDISQKEIHEEIIRTVQEATPPGQEPNLKNISQELYALCLSKMIMAKAQDYILSESK